MRNFGVQIHTNGPQNTQYPYQCKPFGYLLICISVILTTNIILCVYTANNYYSCAYLSLAGIGVGVYFSDWIVFRPNKYYHKDMHNLL